MDARIERLADPRSGRNTWLIGDDDEVMVVDPGSDGTAVLDAAGEREILAVICTHGHASHIGAALEVAARDEAVIALHRRDILAWREVHPDEDPSIEMEAGGFFDVADVRLEVLLTPGHSPGSVSLYCPDLEAVFTGDALLAEGPWPHQGEFPDFAGQLNAIGAELLTLPGRTRVLPGHGEEFTVGQAGRSFDSWAVSARDRFDSQQAAHAPQSDAMLG